MVLTPADHVRIREATKRAEAQTSGEIVCVIAEEASSYCEVPLAWGAVISLVLPSLLLTVGGAGWLDQALRGWSAGHVAASHATDSLALAGYAILQSLLFIAVVLIGSIPVIRRIMTPAWLRRGRVRRRAIEQFHAHELHNTREHTGVLIYASMGDRAAEVIADTGIDAKASAEAWREVISVLTAGIKAGQPGDGFVSAIETAGRVLAAHFPASESNPDELPNDLIETQAT